VIAEAFDDALRSGASRESALQVAQEMVLATNEFSVLADNAVRPSRRPKGSPSPESRGREYKVRTRQLLVGKSGARLLTQPASA
jgi:hypothetical protein